MKYTLVGMAIAVTMYGAGVLIERFSKSRPSKPCGFREWVKNPDGKKAAVEYFAARDA